MLSAPKASHAIYCMVVDTINDNYPKYVLSLDKTDFSRDGIIHKNIISWLLEE